MEGKGGVNERQDVESFDLIAYHGSPRPRNQVD
jgi:hypothetical protein